MRPVMLFLIPAYNPENWLVDKTRSAMAKTWDNKEIITVDNGSTDQTLLVARRFASKTLSVTTQANQGAAATRNRAFSISQGSYIQWLDADDLLGREKISKQMEAREKCGTEKKLLSSAWGRFFYR